MFVAISTAPTTSTRKTGARKTFGDRQFHRRRPISLLLSHHHEDDYDHDFKEDETKPQTKRLRTQQPQPSPKDELTSTEEQEEEEFATNTNGAPSVNSRRVSTSPLPQPPIGGDEFANHDTKTNKTTRYLTKKLKNEALALDRAREYFETLDKTQRLIVEATTPSPARFSSKITRTTRRVDLASPRINREYETYVTNSIACGVSPLPLQDYASSRKLHFQSKNELFDGFFDD
jgi:hypothetical protein